jgi:hypothetical protein
MRENLWLSDFWASYPNRVSNKKLINDRKSLNILCFYCANGSAADLSIIEPFSEPLIQHPFFNNAKAENNVILYSLKRKQKPRI